MYYNMGELQTVKNVQAEWWWVKNEHSTAERKCKIQGEELVGASIWETINTSSKVQVRVMDVVECDVTQCMRRIIGC